jgi:hydrogenase maturation protease
VIALGQAAAGDDGVGLAVLDELRAAPLPDDVELVRAADASALVDLLAGVRSAIVVDAVVGEHAGAVRELAPAELAARAALPVSTHGLDVSQAIELARILHDGAAPEVRIVGVVIERPRRLGTGLSPSAAAAVPAAAARIRELLGG